MVFGSFLSTFIQLQGTEKSLGISLDLDEIDELHIDESVIKKMSNLRYLNIYTSKLGKEVRFHIPETFDYLPPKLKLLCWDKYPMRSLPSKFNPKNLIKLRMHESKLEKLWDGIKVTFQCIIVVIILCFPVKIL